MNPLYNESLRDISEDALYRKHAELSKKLSIARRLGYFDAVYQLQLIDDQFREEMQRRNAERFSSSKMNNGKDFGDYINIGT